MNARGITIASASAGSGKTHFVTEEVTRSIVPGCVSFVPLEGVVAVTFTRRAHGELASRMRRALVMRGAHDFAVRLPLAYVGTVHGVCLRLLRELSLDAGLSPHLEVIADDQEKLLREALEGALDDAARAHLDRLAGVVQLRWDARVRRHDWLTPVWDVMDLARSNRIAPEALPEMAERSAAGLLELLSAPIEDGAPLDAALQTELDRSLERLLASGDARAKTNTAIETIEQARRRIEIGELTWPDWAALEAISPSKACEDSVAGLRRAASRYPEHPRFHRELRELTCAIFEAARLGLSAYAAWKSSRRVIDYIDMLDRSLDVLEQPRVERELERRLGLVAVDELQDTSPIQLALFVRLHRLAGRSVWVGDRKQCIFEYAGADPLLMDAVAEWVEREGGTRVRLTKNHRSRAELVEACSKLFAAALTRHGFSRSEIDVEAVRGPMPALPPLGLWCLDASNKEHDSAAIAEGVRRLLADAGRTPVTDRASGGMRPLRAGDVAILVATNEAARRLATDLHRAGIRAAVARAGLLGTPEGTLADAALRWLLDPSDALAAALLDALTGFGDEGPDVWLTDRLRAVAAAEVTFGAPAWRDPLSSLREELGALSPAEALDRALSALDAVLLCARWPDGPQRIANLDALRALAHRYEDRCRLEREAATVAGLLRYFDDLREERLQRDELCASDHQHVPADDGAVVICTYHKAKGLEWPVVVLADLDRGERRDAFEVAPESDRDAFDPAQPLAGRWIRYWPWPFGQRRRVPLAAAAAQSPAGRRVAIREERERARLLYVGFTRARDHLVLAARIGTGGARTAWLDALADDAGPLVALPIHDMDGESTTRIRTADGEQLVPTRVVHLSPATAADSLPPRQARWFARPETRPMPRLPYRIAPSKAEIDAELTRGRIGRVERLPWALVVHGSGYDYDRLGDAIHGFLACDLEGLAPEVRMKRARRIAEGLGMAHVLRPEDMLGAADALRIWVGSRWPVAVWRREVPVEAFVPSEHGGRRIGGIIDLVLETDGGYVIIDHKTFPAASEPAWRKKCATFVPQLALYAEAVVKATSRPVLACWIHLPIGGGMVELRLAT